MALDTADVRRGIMAGRWRKAGAAERIGHMDSACWVYVAS